MTVITEERRAAKLELREVEISKDLTELTGIAVPYNDPADIGWFVEEHAPGSFAKSIKEAARGLPLHAFHDDVAGQGSAESWPIGVAREWVDDANNLRGVWKIFDDDKSQRAARLAKPDEQGFSAMGYLSIRFAPIKSKWTEADTFNPDLGPGYKDHVLRLQSRLVSVGLVTTPAFARATVEFVRSAERRRDMTPGRRAVDAWAAYLEEIKAGPV